MSRREQYYPDQTYAWRRFRRDFLSLDGSVLSWEKMKLTLEKSRSKHFPKRFREKMVWFRFLYWMKRYWKVCLGHKSLFEIRRDPRMGLGIYARRPIEKGTPVSIFGQLHRVTHKKALLLEKVGETSLIKFTRDVLGKRFKTAPTSESGSRPKQQRRRRTERLEWYYLGGPGELLNHSCKGHNAEYIFDELGPAGEFTLGITSNIAAGDQILVHYGSDFWKGVDEECACEDCSGKSGRS